MSMPPLVLVLVFATLLGWPALKLLATLASRPLWRRQRALRSELLSRPDYGTAEKAFIEETYADGKGDAIQLALPPVAFFGAIAAAYKHPLGPTAALVEHGKREASEMNALLFQRRFGVSGGVGALWQDGRFREFSDTAFALALLRYPVCSLLTAIAIAPGVLAMLVFSGFRASSRRLATALVTASRTAILAFEAAFVDSRPT